MEKHRTEEFAHKFYYYYFMTKFLVIYYLVKMSDRLIY